MKKFIALLIGAFVAMVFTGCAPVEQYPYTYSEPLPDPEPQPKPKPTPKPRVAPRPTAAARPAAKPAPVYEDPFEPKVVTANLYPIPKALDVDNDLSIVSLTPVAYSSRYRCNEVYFFAAVVTPASGYHGIVDISMSETKVGENYTCKYFGSAVTYKVKPNPMVEEIVKYEDVVRKYTTD